MKILFSHPTGNANVRAALNALNDAGLLGSFHTSIACFPNTFYDRMSNLNIFSELNRRRFNEEAYPLTVTHPYKELGRIAASKLKLDFLVKHESGLFSIDAVYQYLDFQVSKSLMDKKTSRAIYAYEDGALQSFKVAKKLGISCFYDLPIGYWKSARRLLEEERRIRPLWANTISGLKDSDYKLQKKDEELSLATHIFVASTFTKNTLLDFTGTLNNVSVIPYGFPTIIKDKHFDRIINRPLKLLFVGGLSQRKGIANVLEAVEKFGNDIDLTIVGRKVTQDCKPLNDGLKKHTWIPSMPNAAILELMSTCDVLLFPSLFEGFGLVITEAMSQGTPVITTDRTAGKDFIEHNKNGWIIEAGSTPELISSIESILNRPDSVAEVGMEAIKTASARSWTDYGRDFSFMIQNLMNEDC